MKWFVPIGLLLLAQESSPVPALLGKIDGRDPVACFRAIADLADLDPSRRAEIAKGAERLPAFYRDALQAELKWPPLAQKRVTLQGKRTFRQQLKELERQTGVKIDIGFLDRSPSFEYQHDGEFSADCSEATAMEALAEVCGAFGAFIERDELSDQLEVTDFGRKHWVAGQRSLILFHKYAWKRKWIDLSSRAEWQAGLHFDALMGPGVRLYGWKDVQVVEAVSDKGGDLRLKPDAESRSILGIEREDENPWHDQKGGFHISLRLPEDVRSVSRLKISAIARVYTRHQSVEVNTKLGNGKGRASKDELDVEVQQAVPKEELNATFNIRVRAKGLTGKELAGRPMIVRAMCSGFKGLGLLTMRRVENETVEYEAVWIKGDMISWTPPPEGLLLESVTVYVADGLEERPVFAEFRDIPLR